MKTTLDRRTFLSYTAKTTALMGATGSGRILQAASARADSLKAYGGFAMGIQSYSLRAFGVEGALDHIRALGLHWVEFFRHHYPPTEDPAKIAAMNKSLAKRDISVSAHGVQSFDDNHEANRRFFRFAKRAGIKNISANPKPNAFQSLDRLVKEFDIRIAIHNHGPGASYDKAAQTLKAVQAYDTRIGFCADLGHYIRSGEDPVKVVHLLGNRLYGVHLKDFAEKKKSTKGVIIGQGHLDVQAVFAALRQVGFPADGALSLEYEENHQNPIDDIRECLAVASKAAQAAARG